MEIGELLKEFTDLDEPACIDKILMYAEELKEEDDMFMQLLIKKLYGKTITWEQPWYQQTKSVSRPLKDQNNEEKEYRTDTICKEENDQIVKNWHLFMEEFDVPDKLVCLARWKNKGKLKQSKGPEESVKRYVVSYLAQGLKRTLFQVFRHIQAYFGAYVRGVFTAEEERIMQVCFTHHPNNAVVLLSTVLGREPRALYSRLQQMYHGKLEHKKIKWTLPLATKFVKLLMKYTGLPFEELKNKIFEKQVWMKLGEKLDCHYLNLPDFWYRSLHVQLFVRKNVKIRKLRKSILKTLKLYPYQIWSDIRWKDIVQHFPDGFTHRFLYHLCYSLIRSKPKYHKVPLEEVIDHAIKKLDSCRKRRLKTLTFNENNELEKVIYDD